MRIRLIEQLRANAANPALWPDDLVIINADSVESKTSELLNGVDLSKHHDPVEAFEMSIKQISNEILKRIDRCVPPFERVAVDAKESLVIWNRYPGEGDSGGWILRGLVYGSFAGSPAPLLLARVKVPLDSNGYILPGFVIDFREIALIVKSANDILSQIIDNPNPDPKKQFHFAMIVQSFIEIGLFTSLRTFSLLNCKNIELEADQHSRQQKRQFERKHNKPMLEYKTLKIRVGRGQFGNQTGTAQTVGLTREHIVRGHFKHYSEDRPLFGKVAGVYWFESAVRGRKKNGVIKKDYEIAE